MDKFEKAFRIGQYQAAEHFMGKEAGAADVAALLTQLGSGASKGMSGLGKALKGALGGAQATGRGAKYLGVTADPRVALGLGGVTAALATLAPALTDETASLLSVKGLKHMAPGAIASVGAGLAAGANPGLLGGSPVNRITHELAMSSATPAGIVASMAGLVGLPAALIGYGRLKGKEESSLF
tara:strand:+ start:5299 stop:5847 length:549 start_codon:yes stop_codon:yes gene_type:complete